MPELFCWGLESDLPGAGLSTDQAAALSELFSGRWILLEAPQRLTVGSLIGFLKRHARNQGLWERLCAVWDTALGALCRCRCVSQSGSLTMSSPFGPESQGKPPQRRRPCRAAA
jgi:hypothetical protein